MTLAIFDLDHTLLDGDGPELWFQFLATKGAVDLVQHTRAQSRFTQMYNDGNLDAQEWADYEAKPQITYPEDQIKLWRDEFSNKVIRHRIPKQSHQLLAEHRALGHTRIVMSATNRFIVEASTCLLDVNHTFGTELETIDDKRTSRIKGTPCFREGKVKIIEVWAQQNNHNFDDAYFYSDSINDLPLLERVANPRVVNPDTKLRSIAEERDWQILSNRVQI